MVVALVDSFGKSLNDINKVKNFLRRLSDEMICQPYYVISSPYRKVKVSIASVSTMSADASNILAMGA